MKYLRIWWRIARMSWMQSMMYKTDFVIGYFTAVVYVVLHLLLIWLFFQAGGVSQLAGFSQRDFYLVFILGEFAWFVISAVAMSNAGKVYDQIHFGELDLFLIRPIGVAFLLSFQMINMLNILISGVYLLIFIIVVNVWGYDFTVLEILYLLIISVLSVVVSYCAIWLSHLIAFYWDRFRAFRWIYLESTEACTYPRQLYPDWFQEIMTFIIPVFLVANPLFDLIAGKLNFWRMGEIVLISLMFVVLFLFVWKDGLRRYNSAA